MLCETRGIARCASRTMMRGTARIVRATIWCDEQRVLCEPRYKAMDRTYLWCELC